jgi:1-acyl-sn-glycerol-3-phosphate acyltransferase
MDHEQLHRRAREKGVNRLMYWLVRVLFQPVFYIYFRYVRIGRGHIPAHGPVIIAANHRSFLDPFVIATMARRPMYYVAKTELFRYRGLAWVLSALGAFPVERGVGDEQTIQTAKAILARGGIVLIFVEGTRIRPGTLGKPKRGVGRLALETGVPVIPVAVIGTEAVRRGIRVRPHKVRIRAGGPLRFPRVENPTPALTRLVTDRIWPFVMLQWEWLGGLPPIRRAAIIGAGAWGTSLAVCLARAGFEVELGCRTHEQAAALAGARENARHLPGVALPDAVRVLRAADLALAGHDLVCVAVPARSLPSVLAAHGERITSRHGVLVASKGLVAPLGTLPCAFAAERCQARAIAALGGPVHAAEVLEQGVAVTLASLDLGFARQLADVLAAAKFDVSISNDVTGVELAGCAADAAILAAGAASTAGPGVAGAAAGKVFAEVDALARSRGGRPETFAGLAGVGGLVATVLADHSAHRRAGELLAQGMPAAELAHAVGQSADAVDYLPMLASAARDARLQTPALDGLAALVLGQIEPEQWTATVTEPIVRKRSRPIRAA